MRQIEHELAETQALVHLGSWNWDIPTDTVSWSDELYRIYGLQPQEVRATYEAFLERLHPEDRSRIDVIVRDSFATGAPFAFDHRIVRSDGSVRWLHGEGEVVRDGAGNPVRMFGTAQDITDQTAAEDALRRGEQQFRTLVASASDAALGGRAGPGTASGGSARTSEVKATS
jgi:PAS domain S-box-containing protein